MRTYYLEQVEIMGRASWAIIAKDGLIIAVVNSQSGAERIIKELNKLQAQIDNMAALIKGI